MISDKQSRALYCSSSVERAERKFRQVVRFCIRFRETYRNEGGFVDGCPSTEEREQGAKWWLLYYAFCFTLPCVVMTGISRSTAIIGVRNNISWGTATENLKAMVSNGDKPRRRDRGARREEGRCIEGGTAGEVSSGSAKRKQQCDERALGAVAAENPLLTQRASFQPTCTQFVAMQICINCIVRVRTAAEA